MENIVKKQRRFFESGATKDIDFRMKALTRLEHAIKHYEADIYAALKKDLNKSKFESYMAEVGMTLSEIAYQKKHLREWADKAFVMPSIAQLPAVTYTIAQPYGVALIMSPWNYPLMLSLEPLAGALAAGNCCVLKPSAYSPETSKVINLIITKAFPSYYVSVIEGGRDANEDLLNQKFDYIFFTGSTTVGRLVMEKAALHLTPVTLELGGKSPCIVERTANLKMAAKKIVFGKFLNSGQTCVAPDYVLVDEAVKDPLVHYLKYWINRMYGADPLSNKDYPKIVNQKHFERLLSLMNEDDIICGGRYDCDKLQIEPTILDHISWDQAVMSEEIFGPVLPLIAYKDINQAIRLVKEREKPLALYLFTKSEKVESAVLKHISFGGGCINDTIIHLASSRMPFGGVGASGMGSYHGKKSFETFSHQESIVKKLDWFDVPVRYQPYTKMKEFLLKKLM